MPTLRELLKLPEYREYFTQPVARAVPRNLRQPGQLPWRVWVKRDPARWGKKDFATFAEAYDLTRRALALDNVRDVALTCRPKGFRPTLKLQYALDEHYRGFDWCKHCRRPVTFAYFDQHHSYALMGHMMYTACESARCPFCGTRKVAQ